MTQNKAIDLISGDRGRATITLEMQMADNYPETSKELERVIFDQFPHLQFWVGQRGHDIILEWEPR